MKFEDVLGIIGGMGPFQICMFSLLGVTSLLNTESIYMNFVGYKPDHWCHVSQLESLPYDIQV